MNGGRGGGAAKSALRHDLARKSKFMRGKISDSCQDRFWVVKRRLKASKRKRFLDITRGLPHLSKEDRIFSATR